MTGYRIGTVHYKNFGPFEDVTLDFDKPGLTVIEGIIEGKRGCDSNGAGKSFLFDGPAWALFGRCIREKYKGDSVVRLHSKGGASVEVNIVGGPHKIRIVRYRKHPVNGNNVLLYVDDKNKSRGTNPATTVAIGKLIGMDFTSFCNSVAFGARVDIKSFFAAADGDRKQVLERILGLELYKNAEKAARKRLTEATQEIEALTLQRTGLQGTLAEKRQLLESLVTSEETEDVEFKAKRRRLKAKRLRAHAVKLEGELGALREDLAAKQAAHEEQMAKFHVARDKYDAAMLKMNQDKLKVQQEIAGLQVKCKTAKKKKVKFDKLSGKVCPECEQKLTKARAEACAKGYTEDLDNAEADIKSAELKLDLVQGEQDKLDYPDEPKSPEEIPALDTEIDNVEEALREAVNDAKVEEARADEMEDAHQRIEAQVKALESEVQTATESLGATESEYMAAKKLSDDLEFWVEGFGNQGLKSFLIEAEIPEINRLATTYAQELLGVGAVVRLNATQALKTKDVIREKLTVEGTIPQCTESYAGASRGQKKRMDLSLLLAFRELVATRDARAFRQLFMDEIFDGLDPTGAETIGELLQGLADGCPVSLVTHDKRVKPAAERVVTVRHSDGRAVIVGAEKTGVKKKSAKKKKVKKAAKRRS